MSGISLYYNVNCNDINHVNVCSHNLNRIFKFKPRIVNLYPNDYNRQCGMVKFELDVAFDKGDSQLLDTFYRMNPLNLKIWKI